MTILLILQNDFTNKEIADGIISFIFEYWWLYLIIGLIAILTPFALDKIFHKISYWRKKRAILKNIEGVNITLTITNRNGIYTRVRNLTEEEYAATMNGKNNPDIFAELRTKKFWE